MDDLEYVIDNASRFERFLETALGARGEGLTKKVRSVEHLLPESLITDLLHIAKVRNPFAHGQTTRLKSREEFERICKVVELELFRLASLNKRDVRPTVVSYSYISEEQRQKEEEEEARLIEYYGRIEEERRRKEEEEEWLIDYYGQVEEQRRSEERRRKEEEAEWQIEYYGRIEEDRRRKEEELEWQIEYYGRIEEERRREEEEELLQLDEEDEEERRDLEDYEYYTDEAIRFSEKTRKIIQVELDEEEAENAEVTYSYFQELPYRNQSRLHAHYCSYCEQYWDCYIDECQSIRDKLHSLCPRVIARK